MKWNKVCERLPLRDELVFVSRINPCGLYAPDYVYIMSYFGHTYWEKLDKNVSRVVDADRWAYIELPED